MLNNIPCSSLLSCIKCIPNCLGIGATQKYTVRWIEAEDISEIVISKTMAVDHFPYNVSRALSEIASSCGVHDSEVEEANSHEEVEKKKC